MKRQGCMIFIPRIGHHAALRALGELENRRDEDEDLH